MLKRKSRCSLFRSLWIFWIPKSETEVLNNVHTVFSFHSLFTAHRADWVNYSHKLCPVASRSLLPRSFLFFLLSEKWLILNELKMRKSSNLFQNYLKSVAIYCKSPSNRRIKRQSEVQRTFICIERLPFARVEKLESLVVDTLYHLRCSFPIMEGHNS